MTPDQRDRRRRGLRWPRREHPRPRRGPSARGDRAASVVVDLDLAARWPRGDRRHRAPARPALGRPAPGRAAGFRPEPCCPCCPPRRAAHVLSARGGAPPDVPRPRHATSSPSLADGPARLVVDVPLSSPLLPAVLASGATGGVLVGLRTRALADADAAVSRLLDAPEAPAVEPDLRLVTRGRRAGADVVDDVVAHLGVAHLHHLGGRPARAPRRRARASSPAPAVTRCAGARTPSSRRSTTWPRRRDRAGRTRFDDARASAPSGQARRRRRGRRAIGGRARRHPGRRRPAAAARGLLDQLVGLGPLAHLAADASVTDLLVNGDGAVWVDRGRGRRARPRRGCRSPTCVRSPCGWPGSPVAGSTTPSRGSTACCPVVCGCTPCCRRSPTAARTSACGSPATAPAASTTLVRLGAATPDLAVAAARRRRRAGLARRHGRHRRRQDDGARRRCSPSAGRERSSSSRTSASSTPTTPTSSGSRVVGPTSRASARSPSSTSCGRPCGCGPTGSSSARCAAREVRELLAALNTGHEGGMSTLHANGPEEVPARFEALGALAGMPRDAVHAQLREALQAVVHVVRRGRVTPRRPGRGRRPRPGGPGCVRVVEAAASSGDGRPRRRARARPARPAGAVGGRPGCRWVAPC